jgi:ABC-type multidrug transport system fused ATPase/permease subunit
MQGATDRKEHVEGPGRAKPTKWQRTRAVLPYMGSLLWPQRFVLAAAVCLLVLSRALGVVLPASVQLIVDQVVGNKRLDLLSWIALAIMAATIAQGATSWATSRLLSNLAQRLIMDLRREVHGHVLRLPAVFFDSSSIGALVSRIMHDVEGLEAVSGTGLVGVMGALLTGAIALVMLLRLDPALALASAGLLAIFAACTVAVFWRRERQPYGEYAQAYGETTGRLTEALGGIRVIKSFGAEQRERERFEASCSRLMNAIMRVNDMSAGTALAGSVFLGIATAAVIFVGSERVLSGAMTLGQVLAFVAFLGMLVGAVLQLVAFVPAMARAIVGLERVQQILTEPREDADQRRHVRIGRVAGSMEVDNLGFVYDGGKQALAGVSLRADPGTVTALVGRSGAGKSTLAAVLASLHVPSAGRVLVDGVDLATVTLESYRSQVGLVLQDAFLFDGTIRENVALARPDASEAEVLDACRTAHVDEFAEDLPARYETPIGERGVRLSAGQRQRIAIARALLANPAILVLDEPTSNLDLESEAHVMDAIAKLEKGRTTFVIAHRLSTLKGAHQVLVLEAGEIVERGTHDDLIKAGGRYAALFV